MGARNTPLQSSILIPPTFEPIPFSNAKSLLGNEYPFAIYDMRAENGVNFNLDAFAIVAGTIQENGTLYLLCSDWENLEHLTDFDSLRWNDGKAVATPNFYRYFKALVGKYGFEICLECRGVCHTPKMEMGVRRTPLQFNTEQQFIFENLPSDPASIHLITAPRGHGKSTLAGKLAETISQANPVVITARSHSALPNFWKQVEGENVRFFAPDRLIQAVENGEKFAKTWLFIDEAASLPLPMLQQCCEHFDKVVLTTTTQNYEGTGRGFELKLPKMLNKPFKHWTLSEPLRWGENDPLENFVNELLLLQPQMGVCNTPLQVQFYHLLASAHYKTTPTDLRRLFDGEQQITLHDIENEQLIAGIWAVNEGGLDEALTQTIWRGERRPQGNLVAQYLCFQGNLPQACELHSVRISRIAVTAEKQRQGIGKRLISRFILQISTQNPPLDFISVSFGITAPLYQFWADCGFELVQITPNKEASSGYRSAMMIYPISAQGKAFCKQAKQAFARDFALQPFFAEISEDLPNFRQFQPLAESKLNEKDWQNLTAFAEGKRALSAVYVSLKRLNLPKITLRANADKAEIAKYRQIVREHIKP
ncbi:GNAT family N-acetyltransferase [Mannheimia varigena]|uniref:GNAT family N-acetyltransferase n=1 Tax=Mannheimia varigena TaxID=85404 RepID=UPI001106ACE7|nr:GNAT family N-acetyltransferase [Mannheimia varigena]TLU76671.1 tRNA(Met) cytidine acetyltransferase [Mannheimia varigena]